MITESTAVLEVGGRGGRRGRDGVARCLGKLCQRAGYSGVLRWLTQRPQVNLATSSLGPTVDVNRLHGPIPDSAMPLAAHFKVTLLSNQPAF